MKFAVVGLIVFALQFAAPVEAGIRDTVHNLAAHGPGTVRADVESRICIFCHTPHRASETSGVLWNRSDSTATYIPYQSPTLQAIVDQPTGASKLCLSCHDGTVALGELRSEPTEIGFVGGVRFMPPGAGLLGTDLSDDHPISFLYDSTLAAANQELVDPIALDGAVRLDAFGELQCTACHDPHDDSLGQFLVASRMESALCLECHDPTDWPTGSHATSTATWNGNSPDPWPQSGFTTVDENACESCHTPHAAQSPEWILQHSAEEDNCLVCHNGNVAATDIQSDITAPSHHTVESTTGTHTPNEDASLPMTAHVECTDCHNPHAATNAAATAPLASGALRGASGIDSSLQVVNPVTYEYEVCFKCHGQFPMTNPVINRQLIQNDKRLQFDPTNPSYHPVVSLGANLNVPSLLPPLSEASLIYCGDCHASDNGPGAGGSGAAGPHGSIFPHILERQYNLVDNVPYDQNAYGLCFKCHSVQSILNNESFKKHSKHIQNESAPCSVCHDPHGVSSTQGNIVNNTNLINFDVTVVSPDPGSGRLEFVDKGTFSGDCYLLCHGKQHGPKGY
ncbi:MAG: cytochrome c3 family protein [Myxococcota bacterium]